MISEKHSAAARANGARSRGPVTPEGKAISSRNALRHGLLSPIIVLPNESPEMFQQLFDMTVARFAPVDDVEMSMIEEMTAAYWKLRRCMAIETSLLTESIDQWPDKEPLEQLTSAFRDAAIVPHLDRLERYQVRLQHMYHRALRGLAHLRKIGKPAPQPAAPENQRNEPSDTNVCNTAPAPRPATTPPPATKPSSRRPIPIAALPEPACQPPESDVFP